MVVVVVVVVAKLVGSHVKKSMTSSFFNRIVFHLAVRYTVRYTTFKKIDLYNFKLKFQMVAEKTAKNFRGYFILLHPVYVLFGQLFFLSL